MKPTLEQLAEKASEGDKLALEQLLGRVKDDVYNLAMRMLGHPEDAWDAAQETLLKVVTHLSSFQGGSSLRTWVWRIAANHVLAVKRGRKEPEALSFEVLDAMLESGLSMNAGAPAGPNERLLEEEVKLGCTQAMLMCLDREHRIAYLLGEVFELSSDEAADVLSVEPATFRKRLSRARERMVRFMEQRCGLVSDSARCRCAKQVAPSIAAGQLDPERLVYAVHPSHARRDPELWGRYQAIEGVHRATAVMRAAPDYSAPERLTETLRRLISDAGL